MQTVYDAKTLEPVTLNQIDARERIRCGLAFAELPVQRDPEPEIESDAPKRGRKPKAEE